MKKLTLITFLSFFYLTTVNCQVSVSSEGVAPHPAASLDLISTDKGLLIPRIETTADRNSIPADEFSESLLIFNMQTKCFETYIQGDWYPIWCCDAPEKPGEIQGDETVCENETGLVYSIDDDPEADSYSWTVPTGWSVTSGQNTNEITVTAGTSGGDISVTAENACGESPERTLNVTVESESEGGTASEDQTIDSGESPDNLTLDGYTGDIQWQYSEDGDTGPWTNETGASATTNELTSGDIGNLTEDRWYRAEVTNNPCDPDYSNVVKITVEEVLTCPEIGDEFGGGVVFYILQDGDPGYVPGGCHAFISETEDQSSGIQFGCAGTTVGTSTDLATGSDNTADIVDDCNDASFAAKLCDDHESGGYDDWFLPSCDELTELCYNRDVVEAKGDDFYEDNEYYYTSSEAAMDGIRYNDFEDCDPGQVILCMGAGCKNNEYRVRCIREFIIEP